MILLDTARSLADEIVALRRDLHRHPELSFQEHRTAGVVARELEALGLEPRTGVGKTGVVCDIASDTEVASDPSAAPTVALRADMDALPIQETNDHDFVSTVEGVMHACGHDGHTSGLIGTAHLLVRARDEGSLPRGTVRLLFQPSEETVDSEGKSGAQRMIEEGALEGVDAIVGLHLWAPLPSGKVFIAEGPVMAGAREVEVVIEGRSAHAALPHDGVDAIVLAAQAVTAVQTAVSRRIDPTTPGVVTFGTIEGGSAPNVIADRVRLRGTIRWFHDEVRETLEGCIRATFGALEAQGAGVEISFSPPFPPTVNEPETTRAVRAAAEALLGEDGVFEVRPAPYAEDFALYGAHVPACFFGVGAAVEEPRRHHHPRFDIDEAALPTGAATLAAAAMELLRRLGAERDEDVAAGGAE